MGHAQRDFRKVGWVTPTQERLNPATDPAAGPGRGVRFGERIDDAAALLHPLGPVRAGLYFFGGGIGVLILPWRVCLAWVATALAMEFWTWSATRRQARGEPVGWFHRANFTLNYLCLNLIWLVMAALFWRTGALAGQASALVLALAIGSISVMLFYSAPAAFLAAGAAPAIGALSLVCLADGRDWRQVLPIALTLTLALVFNLGRALDTPSAQEQQRWLRDTLNDYEILAQNVSDIISRLGMDGVYQYISPASLTVLGYPPEALVGARLADLVHPDSVMALETALAQLTVEKRPSVELNTRIRHQDGRWIWLQTSVKALYQNGVPIAVIGVSRDVTERVAADIALQEAKMAAEAASQAKAEFLANVSHEIRTPMNGVLGVLHILDREVASAEGRELLRHADDCGRMLSQLLNDVLDFSKIEAGQLELSSEPLRPGQALETVTALLSEQAKAKGVELRCEITGGELWVLADPLRLRQAMFNLIGNAVKFTNTGYVAARLTVEDRLSGRRAIRFEVEDTGIGMTPQAQAHLFERFRQGESDTARRFSGTGLGLSITRALARMMGGDVSFTSVEDQGSTFTLAFEAPSASPPREAPASPGLLDGARILLVDDNATNRLVTRSILARLGAQVDEAENGQVGLEAAQKRVYDLILMDIQMPVMDGLETTREIRKLPGAFAQPPILALTANAMTHQRDQYLAAGMNGVVVKPISPAALLSEIARLTTPDPIQQAS